MDVIRHVRSGICVCVYALCALVACAIGPGAGSQNLLCCYEYVGGGEGDRICFKVCVRTPRCFWLKLHRVVDTGKLRC